MNLRDLMDVKAICDAGSFRKAAAVRGVTQPTLSNRIAHLEDQLGARLFDRSRGQSQPTDLARFIASRSEAIAAEATVVTREIDRLVSGQAGTVRIGFGPGPMRSIAEGIVQAVGRALPGLTLEILSAPTPRLGEGLLQRELDVALCPPIEIASPLIETVAQIEAPVVVVANPAHAIFADAPPSLTEVLTRYPVALPPLEHRYLRFAREQFGIAVEQVPGRLVCSDYELLVRIVATGNRYVTAGPAFAFASEIASGRLRVLDLPVPFEHIVAMQVNRDALPFPAVARVQDIIRGLLPQLAGDTLPSA